MEMRLIPAYIAWMFDSKAAWEKTVRDPRYRYDMPHEQFMILYTEHRGATAGAPRLPSMPAYGSAPSIPASTAPSTSSAPKSVTPMTSGSKPATGSAPSQLLSQDEIDALISQMGAK